LPSSFASELHQPSALSSRRDPCREFNAYQERAGHYLYEDFRDAIDDPEWSALDSGTKVKRFNKLKSEARKAARAELFGGASGDLPPVPPGFELQP
jgi:hypothetical protein